jgi:hypothetical protein
MRTRNFYHPFKVVGAEHNMPARQVAEIANVNCMDCGCPIREAKIEKNRVNDGVPRYDVAWRCDPCVIIEDTPRR